MNSLNIHMQFSVNKSFIRLHPTSGNILQSHTTPVSVFVVDAIPLIITFWHTLMYTQMF